MPSGRFFPYLGIHLGSATSFATFNEQTLNASGSGPYLGQLGMVVEESNKVYRLVKFDNGYREHVVILDADLPAASHSLTGGTSCLATVCEWDAGVSDYIETSRQLTVWNHAENANHVTDTFGYARFIDGHWHFFGDCHPMGAR